MIETIEYRREKSEDDGELALTTKRSYFANPVTFLMFFSALAFLEAASLFGYFAGVLTSIERRFQLPSTTSGTLSTISEISALSVLIFVCYFGAKLHIPRVVGAGGITLGIGLLLTALPHVIFEPYQPTYDYGNGFQSNDTNDRLMCSSENMEHTCSEQETEDVKYGRLKDIWPIAVGQIIMGIGTAALYPLSIPYLDDSTKDRSTTGLYIAILMFITTIGPFTGFSVSAKVLGYRTDFYKHNDTSVQADGSGSIGAWWLGFVIFGTLCIVVSIPILFFPRKLAVWESQCMSRLRTKPRDGDFDVAAAYRSFQPSGEKQEIFNLIKEFLVALKRLVTNPVLVLLNFGIAAFASVGAGMLYFFAKYLETQFNLNPAKAAFLTGVVFLPGNLFGIVVGGVITSSLRLRTVGMCRLVIVLTCIGLLLTSSGLLVKCPQQKIAGLTTGYNISYGSSGAVGGQCNENCSCPSNVYQPICGPDGVTTYMSPCHAGCMAEDEWNKNNDRNVSTFSDCSCFPTLDPGKVATYEACPRNCNQLITYLTIIIFWGFLGSVLYNPIFLLVMRTVDVNDRALSLGCFGLSYRVLAFIPAPIYFGAIIQSTCILRSSLCGQEGVCLVYDTDKYRLRYICLQVGLLVLAVFFFIITLLLIKRQKSASHTPLDTNNPDDVEDATTNI